MSWQLILEGNGLCGWVIHPVTGERIRCHWQVEYQRHPPRENAEEPSMDGTRMTVTVDAPDDFMDQREGREITHPVDGKLPSERDELRQIARKCWQNWMLYASMDFPPGVAPGCLMALKYAESHPWLLDDYRATLIELALPEETHGES